MGYFKCNNEFLSKVLIKNSIVFTFLCRFCRQNKCFSISKFLGKLDFLHKKFYNIDYCLAWFNLKLISILTTFNYAFLTNENICLTLQSKFSNWFVSEGETSAA